MEEFLKPEEVLEGEALLFDEPTPLFALALGASVVLNVVLGLALAALYFGALS